ncbi:MAG: hypothetical protein ACN4GG_09320 [Akkermansiaceae bacterium]
MESDLQQLEAELQKLSPQGVPDDLVSRLDEAMCKWHEAVPVEEKVIALNEPMLPQKESWFQWRAVAAVAIFGAAAALFLTQQKDPAQQQQQQQQVHVNQAGVSQATFTPRQAKAQVVGFQEQGYVTSPSGQTLRAVKFQVLNQVYFRNGNGDHAKIEKPTYEVIYLPVESD